MKILISGSYGLVGSALVPALTRAGHVVTRLVRMEGQPGILWKPESSLMNSTPFEGFDAVIHLAGESIAGGRWTEEKKKRIRDSRINGTRLLVNALTRVQALPRVIIAASAIGYYGNRGSELLTEAAPPGSGFLADVCKAWEAATASAQSKGIRVANLRFGVILNAAGGALAKMLTPFKFGLGGPIGGGRQFMSWVDLDDVVGIVELALTSETLKGPVNVVAPRAVTNAEFTRSLGQALSRPAFLPMPAFAAKIVFGEMADELLLASQRVQPAVLEKAGYRFRYPDLDSSFRHQLKR
jgi:uncharacterized protein (TIGR01777 family)